MTLNGLLRKPLICHLASQGQNEQVTVRRSGRNRARPSAEKATPGPRGGVPTTTPDPWASGPYFQLSLNTSGGCRRPRPRPRPRPGAEPGTSSAVPRPRSLLTGPGGPSSACPCPPALEAPWGLRAPHFLPAPRGPGSGSLTRLSPRLRLLPAKAAEATPRGCARSSAPGGKGPAAFSATTKR